VVLASPPLPDLGDALHLRRLAGLNPRPGRHTDRDEVHRLVANRIKEHTASHWLDLLRPLDLPIELVLDYPHVVNDPQVALNESLLTYEHPTEGTVTTPGFPIKFSKTPAALHRPTPQLGEHSREILTELGFGDRVDALASSGIIAVDPPLSSPGALRDPMKSSVVAP
jgi:crotonobetainyl-CoA:carnitine CoA-transferase CaiB-like acyl-CoA transferase